MNNNIIIATNILFVKDYANLLQAKTHSLAGWSRIRSLIVNQQGDTVSMLIKAINSDFDFNFPPPLSSLLSIIKEL